MARLRFKKKCNICKEKWVLVKSREYTICVPCHMKKIFSEEVTDKAYDFLNADREIYEESRFLRNIRQSYLMYKELSDKQIEVFKKVLEDVKNGDVEHDES